MVLGTVFKPVFPVAPINEIHLVPTAKLAQSKVFVSSNRLYSEPELERIFLAYGLVSVSKMDSTIWIDLRYATHNNFLGRNLYGTIRTAYLQKDVAEKLVKASTILRAEHPELRLVVLDAARPLSIQKQMWVDVNLPGGNKEKFVASPSIGSLHNYGAAVDVTLAYTDGRYLDMGTPYDSFSDTAYTVNEEWMVQKGMLTREQFKNRQLLRKVMKQAGFYPIETEWWHFNACSRNYAKAHYPLIVSHIYEENPLLTINQQKTTEQPFVESKHKVVFKVQILTASRKYSGKESFFKGLKVSYYVHDNMYKYTVGNYVSLEKAIEELDKIKLKGFTDAFIVAFYQNERISIKDAVELLHND